MNDKIIRYFTIIKLQMKFSFILLYITQNYFYINLSYFTNYFYKKNTKLFLPRTMIKVILTLLTFAFGMIPLELALLVSSH